MIKNKLILDFTREDFKGRINNITINRNQADQLQEIQFFKSKILIKKTSDLPQIQSPFLKRAVLNLFATNQSNTLAPIKRYNNEKQSLKTRQQHLIQNKSCIKRVLKSNKNMQVQSLLTLQKTTGNQGKSYSEPKHVSKIIPRNNSIQEILTPQQSNNFINDKKPKKIITEQSNRSESKDLYQKLRELKQKDRFYLQKSNKSAERDNKKDLKCSNFVLKHKMNKELYSSEKQQIKYIKTFFNNGSQIKLDKSIKIKNYMNFFPNVINIQN